ncbi:MAG: hypothetical protein KAH23_09400 [Kiritimatiellae bacterium]|nr:hypothetical protein [Kiritimatiellia bacterium]
MKRIITICIVTALGLMSARGAVINVPADYPTIQAAITAAASNDTVQVEAGTYYENVFLKPGIALLGAGPDTTTIHGNYSWRVITVAGCNKVEVEGFTITGGVSGDLGGGIYCGNSTMTIRDCVITNNIANYGGGIHCQSSVLYIIDTVISGNRANYIGGGIYLVDTQEQDVPVDPLVQIIFSPQPIIANCIITANTAKSGNGGGVACHNSTPTIVKTEISRNLAATSGGGIDCRWDSCPWVLRSIVSDNTAGALGGGIACQWDCMPSVTSTVIARNSAMEGGAIYCNFNSSPSIAFSTVAFNAADHVGGMLCVEPDSDSLSYCILWGNGDDLDGIAAEYSCIEDGDLGIGNIVDDPLFKDIETGNYRLSMLSPCINTHLMKFVSMLPLGCPDELRYMFTPASDLDGNPRLVNRKIDMGAYEFQGSVAVSPPAHDFGDVEIEMPVTAIIFVSSLTTSSSLPPGGDLTINSVSIVGNTDFEITSPAVIPDNLPAEGLLELELTFTPSAEGYTTGTLVIETDAPYVPIVEIPLGGMGITTAQARQEQIEEIGDDLEGGIEDGTIVGEGAGASADKRVNALNNMLDAVGDLIIAEEYELAYSQLESLYKKIDGQPKPPDFVSGPAVDELRLQVEALLEALSQL